LTPPKPNYIQACQLPLQKDWQTPHAEQTPNAILLYYESINAERANPKYAILALFPRKNSDPKPGSTWESFVPEFSSHQSEIFMDRRPILCTLQIAVDF
jgi:hypothetical protein